jgi:hypothetical protein
MKPFYSLVFLVGLCMAVFMQVVTIAIPRDAVVASVLSKSPARWEITLDDGLKSRLVPYNVKSELVVALQKRRSICDEIYSENLWAVGLMVFSAIGLARERKIDRMRRMIEQGRCTEPGGDVAVSGRTPPAQGR